MDIKQSGTLKLIMVCILSVPLSAVTVNPALCPSNKIAPHRRILRWDWEYQPRTLGAFYDLLRPGPGGAPVNQGYDPNLQEQPQKDDFDDCGDIDDYDENDLSSLTPQYQPYQRRIQYGSGDSRFFFNLFGQRPQNPQQPQPQQPQHPQPQRPPIRPPYSSGGLFQNNHYRPPLLHNPSDEIKPVHEGYSEPQTTYKPFVVGGPSGHVFGATPVSVRPRPDRRPQYDQATGSPNYMRYGPIQPPYTTRQLNITPQYQPYQRRIQYGSGDSRFFFNLFGQRPQNQNPQQPQPQHPQPQRPPIRPPYSSGGIFQNNHYRPPMLHNPSDEIKPVYEGYSEPQTTYKPFVVGGRSGHVFGATPVSVRPRPDRRPEYDQSTGSPNYVRFAPIQPPYTTKRPNPRQLNNNNSTFGSFIDLLLK